jgi:hypothetical protein
MHEHKKLTFNSLGDNVRQDLFSVLTPFLTLKYIYLL